MELIIVCGCLLLALALFIFIININFRAAYFFYKIPKLHWVIHFFVFRKKAYLKETELFIPHSIMPIIDDMGWSEGSDLRKKGGPSRLITDRGPIIEDYANVVEIGRQAGVRIPGMFVISDFDQAGVCALPEYNMPIRESNLTEQGLSWKNSTPLEYNQKIMDYLGENSEYLEIGLHGVRHEHFHEGTFQNAEWADGTTGESWGIENAKLHCEAFEKILRQYFSPEECSFPKSFVPPSHAFAYHSEDARILNEYGIKYMCCSCKSRPSMKFLQNTGIFKDGVLMLDRTELVGVHKTAHVPKSLTANAWIGTHFPNYWGNSIKKWVRFLRNINQNYDTMLGRNTVYNNSQWIYNHYTASQLQGAQITLNNLHMPQWVYDNGMANGIWLKAHLHSKQHISQVELEGLTLGAYYEDENDNAYVYLLNNNEANGALERKLYQGRYTLGTEKPQGTYVDIGRETFTVKGLRDDGKAIRLSLEVYGKHVVKLHTKQKISQAVCNHSHVKEITVSEHQIQMVLQAGNRMGETVELVLEYC